MRCFSDTPHICDMPGHLPVPVVSQSSNFGHDMTLHFNIISSTLQQCSRCCYVSLVNGSGTIGGINSSFVDPCLHNMLLPKENLRCKRKIR